MFLIFSGFTELFSQPWLNYLPSDKQGNYTLFDYQQAFATYSKQFKNVSSQNGEFEENGIPGYEQFKRWEWYWEPRVNPVTGEFPKKSAWQVWQDYKTTHSVKSLSGTWVCRGDYGYDGYDDGSPQESGTGRLNCVLFDPNDDNHFWVGAPTGGLWETTDGGKNWVCLTDNNPILGVSDIAIPPDYDRNTNPVIYIATGDRDAGDDPSIGVLVSNDGGQTWNTTGLTFAASSRVKIGRLIINPNDKNVMWAATTWGLYKSTDAGANWTRKKYDDFIDMELIPGSTANHAGTILGSTKSSPKVYKSTDGGESWTTVFSGTSDEYRCDIAVTPADTDYVYIVTSDNANNSALYGVYQSTNAGDSFTKVFDGRQSGNNLYGWYVNNNSSDGGQGWYDVALAVSNTDRDVVYLGGVNGWISTDGASSFTICNGWTNGLGCDIIHADHHNAYFRPSDNRLFDVNDGGIYYCDNVTSGTNSTWTAIMDGIVVGMLYDIGVAQATPNELVAGFQDNGTKLMDPDVSLSDWFQVKGGDGMCCAIDPTNTNNQWGTYTQLQIDRTTDEWTNKSSIRAKGNAAWAGPLEADPQGNQTIYIGTDRVEKYVGTTNTDMTGSQLDANYLRALDVYNDGTNLVIWTAGHNGCWKSDNTGHNYTQITGLPSDYVTDIAIDEDDYNHVYLCFGSYDNTNVYETTDGGANWTDISNGLPAVPCGAIVINEQNTDNEVYVGTDAGIYVKVGSGSWQLFNTGMPLVSITDLEIYYDNTTPANSRIYAATYGRGAWVSDLYNSASCTPPTTQASNFNVTDTNDNDVTISWTRGDGDQVIVLAHEANAVDDVPVSGTSYTANAAFGSGDEIGDGNYVVYTGTGTSVNVTGLTAGTTYYFSVFEYNTSDNCYLIPGLEGHITTTGTPPCSYCAASGGGDEYISGVTLGSINNTGTSADGYADYTSMSTDLALGQSYDITVQNGHFYLDDDLDIWIDWNHDCDFDDAGEHVLSYPDGGASGTYSIIVPSDATLGQTTMRIRIKYDGPADPCGTTSYGEVEDYSVNVISGGPAPVITQQPQDTTVCEGGTATFSVTATNADSYQWQKDGSNISGATSDTYTINSVTSSDAGSYTCVVSNSNGSTTSNSATLTVNPATAITTQPSDATACAGDNVTFSVTATGSNLTYQWQKDGSDISGATSDTYTINGVSSTDAGSYTCDVTGDCGSVTSNSSTLTLNPATAITTQPSDATACAGDNVTFSVTATGSNLTYQWQKDGSDISGATSDTYTINGVSSTDAGSYTCDVTGDCGSVTSNSATLTVNPATAITTQPSDATACAGDNVTFSVTATGSNLTYQWQKDGSDISGATSDTYTINGVSSTDAGSYTCVVTGDCGSVTSNSATLTLSTPTTDPASVSATDTIICSGESTTLTYSGGSGDTFVWYSGSCGGTQVGTGNNLSVSPTSTTTYYGRWENSCGESSCLNVTITVSTEITANAGNDDNTCTDTYTLSANDPTPGTGQWTISSGSGTFADASDPNTTLTIASSPVVATWTITNGSCVSSDNVTITQLDSTEITTQPVSVTDANLGDTVEFTVVATGSNLTYQWQLNANDISGATSDTYTINGVTTADTGTYTVVVSGDCGSVTSEGAVLAIVVSDLQTLNELGVKLYPNPTNGDFTIAFNKITDLYNVSIVNANGKVVYNSTMNERENRITLNLPAGIYTVKVYNATSSHIIKMVVK